MSSQIYIKGFSRATSKEDLRDFFRNYQGIDDVRMIKDYAFIVLSLLLQGFQNTIRSWEGCYW